MKLAVYAIAKNEAQHVARWYESVKDFDEIVVVDTGSTDNTVELLRSFGVRVHQMTFVPFRFDTARNAALNQVSLDVDYCFFLDLDETMPPGSVQKMREAVTTEHDSYSVRLVFTFDSKRNPLVHYPREALHKRNAFFWKYPVHELLQCHHPEYQYGTVDVDVYHEPDVNKPRTSYFELLQMAVAEDPNDSRNMLYLGREFLYRGQYFEASMWLQKHISLERYAQFRSESARYLSQCFQAMEQLDEAEAWLMRACFEQNDAREPFCDLAQLYFVCEEYESAIGACRSALRITERPTVPMLHEESHYTYWPYHMLAACYDYLGYDRLARENIQIALEMSNGAVPQSLLNDTIRILGIANAHQPVSSQAVESREGNVPEDGLGRSEELSGGVPEEHAQVPAQRSITEISTHFYEDPDVAEEGQEAPAPDKD